MTSKLYIWAKKKKKKKYNMYVCNSYIEPGWDTIFMFKIKPKFYKRNWPKPITRRGRKQKRL